MYVFSHKLGFSVGMPKGTSNSMCPHSASDPPLHTFSFQEFLPQMPSMNPDCYLTILPITHRNLPELVGPVWLGPLVGPPSEPACLSCVVTRPPSWSAGVCPNPLHFPHTTGVTLLNSSEGPQHLWGSDSTFQGKNQSPPSCLRGPPPTCWLSFVPPPASL